MRQLMPNGNIPEGMHTNCAQPLCTHPVVQPRDLCTCKLLFCERHRKEKITIEHKYRHEKMGVSL